jgi:hypothetical protein
MRSKGLLLVSLLLFMFGCSKDNGSGGPTIGIKSYTSSVHNDGGNGFSATLSFSQSGGNISGDSLVIMEHRYNQSYAPDLGPFGTRLPLTPSASKAEFTTQLAWIYIQYGVQDENDTVDFKFVLIDQNLKHSDTVTTGKVIIYQF